MTTGNRIISREKRNDYLAWCPFCNAAYRAQHNVTFSFPSILMNNNKGKCGGEARRLGVSSAACSSDPLIVTFTSVIARRGRDRVIKERQGGTTV